MVILPSSKSVLKFLEWLVFWDGGSRQQKLGECQQEMYGIPKEHDWACNSGLNRRVWLRQWVHWENTEPVHWFLKDISHTDHRAVAKKEVLWRCRYYKGSYNGDEHLELQAQTNGLGSQGRVSCSPGVRFSTKRVCNICCKLQLLTRKVEHGKGNSIVKQIVPAT